MRAQLRGSIFFLFFSAFFLAAHSSLLAQAQQPPNPSIEQLISRADSGDSSALHQLSQFLIHADPASPGFNSALGWLRATASRNVPQAQVLLGYLYEHGRGIPRDYAIAAQNYQAAARQGYHTAQNNLAFLYQHGFGAPKDLRKAFDLYLASARQGDRFAQCNVASMYFSGSGTSRSLPEAARWFRAAADLGDPIAQHNLAVFYSEGIAVPLSYTEAARWEDLAARQGYALAEAGLAFLYENGKGVPLDYISAHAWYSRALAAGDKDAAVHLNSLSHIMTRKQLDDAEAFLLALPPASHAPSASVDEAELSTPQSP
jgi:TPR repeat protein